MHVHVYGSDGEAKYCLEPEIELARNHRLSSTELRIVEDIIEEHYDELTSARRQHFGG
jgi:hypothetical protein